MQWLENKVLGWLDLVYSEGRKHTYADCIAGYKGRLLHFLFETFAKTQIEQLFNIIIEFPESEPAILDLKVCLEKTDQRSHLVSSLKSALETRLLHPGQCVSREMSYDLVIFNYLFPEITELVECAEDGVTVCVLV